MTFGMVPINKIEFDIFSRHEITPILMSLQHLYVHEKEALMEILNFIKSDINRDDSDKLGCCGLNYWEILILASVRLGCDLDFDALQDLADNHRNLRQMLMVGPYDDTRYPRSTIHGVLPVSVLMQKKIIGGTLARWFDGHVTIRIRPAVIVPAYPLAVWPEDGGGRQCLVVWRVGDPSDDTLPAAAGAFLAERLSAGPEAPHNAGHAAANMLGSETRVMTLRYRLYDDGPGDCR